MKFDMHCHIAEGSVDSTLPLRKNIELCREKGYDGLMITDHDTYSGWRYYEKEVRDGFSPDFIVLRGIEYDTRDGGHILVVMPTDAKSPHVLEIRGMKVAELIEFVHGRGGILGPAHPCGEPFMSFTHAAAGRHNAFMADQFDFIETFNSCEYQHCNADAAILARELSKPCFGGSDSHRIGSAAMGWTEISEEIRNEDDLIRCVLNHKEAFRAGGEYYHHTTKETVGQLNSLFSLSFGAYNRTVSLLRSHERHEELEKAEKSRGVIHCGRHYTEI
ncbi:MAG: PHP domain-containing protein [Lachnospiraceae bacterium]|jgi:predicted metal-dependent phosphoesterase TrpH|nr:PHP domain-containing protein [Lachnospiraceae bacterium]